VLTGSADTTAKLWSAIDGALVRTFSGHASWISSVAFSPDGRQALTGSWDSRAKLWSVADGSVIRTFPQHSGAVVTSVAFSPDGAMVLTGADDNTAKLWCVTDGALIRTYAGHTAMVESVAFSADGRRVLTGGNDCLALLWETGPGHEASFMTHPRSYVAVVGEEMRLSAAATGALPLAWQWQKNGADLPGETNSTLLVTNAQPADAGQYSVRVSNAHGGATSQTATLIVVVPVHLSEPGRTGARFRLCLPTVSGAAYTLECSDSLAGQDWRELGTMTGDGTVKEFADAGATTPQRFYRVSLSRAPVP
jgi:WD40 repeat protein